MKPIYYAIFAINGFTALIWILFFVNAFIRNRCIDKAFREFSPIRRCSLKIKDDSLSLVGNTLEEKDETKSIREGLENNRSG